MAKTSKYSSNPQETSQSGHPGVTFRAILIGIILIPPNTYFIMANHLRYRSTLPTTMSLIYNVVVTLVVLTCLNFLVKRLLPRFALRQGELLTDLRDSLNLFGDRWTRYDADSCACDSKRLLVCDP